MMNAPSHRTYQELCDDPDQNPMGTGDSMIGLTGAQFTTWIANTPLRLTHIQLLDDLLLDQGNTMSGGVGVMVAVDGNDSSVLRVIHGLCKHPGRDEHRGTVFAYRGDVEGYDIDVIQVSDDLFRATESVTVADDVEYHLEVLLAHPDSAAVPAFLAGAARTRSVRTRNSMYIPFPLIPYVIERDLTARQALSVLFPVIQDMGLEAACAPLLDYLVVASTMRAVEPHYPITVQLNEGTFPEGCRPVTAHRRKHILFRQLPDLEPGNNPRTVGLAGIDNSLREFRNATVDDMNDRRAERAQKAAVKTVGEKWPHQFDRLLKLCGVTTEKELPTYWHDAASFKKGSGTTMRTLLQDATELASAKFGVIMPHVTVQHINALQNFLLIGSSDYSLEGGLLPFTVTPPGAVSAEATAMQELDFERTADYTTILEGNSSITAADARAMRCSKAYIPQSMDEAESMLESYLALLGAMLGHEHAVVLAHQKSLVHYRAIRPHLKQILVNRMGPQLAASTLVYYYHAKYRNWFRKQWRADTTGPVPPPALSDGFDAFADGYNLSWLPSTEHIPVLLRLASARQPVPPRAPAAINPNESSSGNGPSMGPPSPSREPVRNLNRDMRLFGDDPIAGELKRIKIRELIEKASTPAPRTGNRVRCLTWHLKGACFANCGRSSDHVALSSDDKEALFKWCKLAVE